VELFDTHCHVHEMTRRVTSVYDKWYEDGAQRTPSSVIGAAHEAGVSRMLCVGTTVADSELAVIFAREHAGMWASVGIHPHEAAVHSASTMKEEFKKLLTEGIVDGSVIAIGECGLDYFYSHSPREAQIELLRFQIELALEHDLPVSFHVRQAFDDFWPIFESYQGAHVRGVLHSFTDDMTNLERAIKHGLYFGINGIATFAKNPAQKAVYQAMPCESVLLETDAPFLTPVPFRGTICEPKHVRVTAQFLADLRGETLEDLAATTTANARALLKV
jgi:TatD DNase family protein